MLLQKAMKIVKEKYIKPRFLDVKFCNIFSNKILKGKVKVVEKRVPHWF